MSTKSVLAGVLTYELHNGPNSSLDVDAMVTVNRNQARLRSDDWEIDKRAIVVHGLLDLFQALRKHPVELSGQNCSVPRNDAFALQQSISADVAIAALIAHLMHRHLKQHISCSLHAKELASDKNQILLRQQSRHFGTQHARERRRKVNVGPSLLLDGLYNAAFPTSDNVV